MNSYAEVLIDQFSSKGLLIDTNLLLLHTIASYDEGIIARGAFDRVGSYTVEDCQLLRGLMSLFSLHLTTAHVLAELSNWVGYLPERQKISCRETFARTFANFTELKLESFEVARHPRFAHLGLTDTGIARVASEYLVLTDDARFVFHLNEMGLEALNINHIRQEVWLLE